MILKSLLSSISFCNFIRIHPIMGMLCVIEFPHFSYMADHRIAQQKIFTNTSYAPTPCNHLILLTSMMESITETAGKYVLYNPDLKVLICRNEKHCVSPGTDKPGDPRNFGVISHFRRSEHKGIPRLHRAALNQYISGLGIAKPHDIVIPSPESRPIAGLELHRDGAECLQCNELTSDERQMKKHCRTKHGWDIMKDPIWKKQAVQTFFKSHGKELKYVINGCTDYSYIRITPDESSRIEPLSSIPKYVLEDLLKTAKEQDEERIRNLNKVQDSQDLTTLTIWRRHTEWHETFKNRDMGELHELAKKPRGDDKHIIAWNGTRARIKLCFEGVLDLHRRNWHLIPFWLASADPRQEESVPFRRYFKPDVIKKYSDVWAQYICFCLATLHNSDRYGIQFTNNQRTALEDLERICHQTDIDDIDEAARASAEAQILKVSIELIRHKDWEQERSSLLYFSGILGFHLEDHRWREAHEYTPTLAALLFCMRVLMLEHALPVAVRDNPENFRREDPLMIFRRTRDYWLVEGTPTPFNYLHKLLNYGMKAGRDGRGRTICRWSQYGQLLHFGARLIRMKKWKKMVHNLLKELEEVLSEKLLFRKDKMLPYMDLNSMIDDPERTEASFYFGKECSGGHEAARKRMLEALYESGETDKWIQVLSDGKYSYLQDAINSYERQDKRFREKLFILMILTCGLAGRTTEMSSLRYMNTMNGDRNIYLEDGQIHMISNYHKSMAITNELKVRI